MLPPAGPHAVAVHDARLPDIAGGHRLRLFYPSGAASTGRGPARWLPRSLGTLFADETVVGIMNFVKIPFPQVVAAAVSWVAHSKLYATLDCAMSDAMIRYPIVLFSHGLGGSIAGYSIACIDMASHGHIVAAIEHSDGSALTSFTGEARKHTPYRFYRGADIDGPEWQFRHAQLQTRMDDLDALLAALHVADSSGGQQLIPLDSLRESQGPDLQGRLDFENVTFAGHSFGGGTALAYGMRRPSLPQRIICLDAWLFSLRKEDLVLQNSGLREGCPILFVDMELSKMTQSIVARQAMKAPFDVVSVLGAYHNNSSDFPVTIPMAIATRAMMTAKGSDPDALLATQNEAVAAFLTGKWPVLKDELSKAPAVRGMKISLPVSPRH
jgi:platelet-activating factor acetylhydrolase